MSLSQSVTTIFFNMAVLGSINCLLAVFIVNICTGQVLHKPQLNEQVDEKSNNDIEVPSYGKQRYKCHFCEPPDCSNPTICVEAVQCWKSRVRDRSGEESVARGCTNTAEQVPFSCRIPTFSVQCTRYAVDQFNISCCEGDLCNNGEFPELPPVCIEETTVYNDSIS